MPLTNDTSRARAAGDRRPFEASFTRRTFLGGSAAILAAAAASRLVPPPLRAADPPVEARYYEKLSGARVRCLLCPRGCVVPDGGRGLCGVRENRGGVLRTLVYGRPCAIHLDPIEKKPFFHVLPGTSALSLATVGCNLDCKFCQNWQIARSRPEDAETRYTPPAAIVDRAVAASSPSIAYTYGEPVVFIEYVRDIAAHARSKGIRSVVISNGYIMKEPLLDLCRTVDAIKIDLKAFDDAYYRDVCGGSLAPVLETIATIRASGVWLELVYLVVPTLNDDPAKIREMARWIVSNVGPDVPLHFSRFFPQYRLANLPPTPVSTLDRAHDACRDAGIRFVYVGNVPGHEANHTICPQCGKRIIARSGYRIEAIEMRNGACRFCGETIPGIWREA
jgi:pyruvate formate lyase activating enzyme